jgi:hypothetical protein
MNGNQDKENMGIPKATLNIVDEEYGFPFQKLNRNEMSTLF